MFPRATRKRICGTINIELVQRCITSTNTARLSKMSSFKRTTWRVRKRRDKDNCHNNTTCITELKAKNAWTAGKLSARCWLLKAISQASPKLKFPPSETLLLIQRPKSLQKTLLKRDRFLAHSRTQRSSRFPISSCGKPRESTSALLRWSSRLSRRKPWKQTKQHVKTSWRE